MKGEAGFLRRGPGSHWPRRHPKLNPSTQPAGLTVGCVEELSQTLWLPPLSHSYANFGYVHEAHRRYSHVRLPYTQL
jgi:hypothetical protein